MRFLHGTDSRLNLLLWCRCDRHERLRHIWEHSAEPAKERGLPVPQLRSDTRGHKVCPSSREMHGDGEKQHSAGEPQVSSFSPPSPSLVFSFFFLYTNTFVSGFLSPNFVCEFWTLLLMYCLLTLQIPWAIQ